MDRLGLGRVLLFGFVTSPNSYRMALSRPLRTIFLSAGVGPRGTQRHETASRRRRFEDKVRPEEEALHHCATCGATELTNPNLEFRVSRDEKGTVSRISRARAKFKSNCRAGTMWRDARRGVRVSKSGTGQRPSLQQNGLGFGARLDPIATHRETPAMDPTPAPLIPQDGWHCLHLFYRIEYGQWQLLSATEQRAAKIALSTLVQETRALESTQLLTLSQVTPKADLGFMLITPDLHLANRIEKQLTLSLGPDVLVPVYSYLSLTEESEYITTEEQYAATLETEQKLKRAARSSRPRMQEFRERMKKIPAGSGLSHAARLAGRLFLQHDETPRRKSAIGIAPSKNAAADGRSRARRPPVRWPK